MVFKLWLAYVEYAKAQDIWIEHEGIQAFQVMLLLRHCVMGNPHALVDSQGEELRKVVREGVGSVEAAQLVKDYPALSKEGVQNTAPVVCDRPRMA